MERQNEIEINLVELLFFLRRKIWIIVAACLLCGALGAIFTAFFAEDEYTAKTRMYVLNRSQGGTASSDYNVSNYMIEDYKVLITGDNVTKEVIKTLGLNMTTEQLAKKIAIEAIKDTRVLQIKVVDSNPQRAADIANCVREVAGQQLKEIMNLDAVNLVYAAEVPDTKTGPNITKSIVIFAVIGAVAALVVLMIIFASDDMLRTEEDVERRMGLSVLGVIPMSAELAKMTKSASDSAKKNEEAKKKSMIARFVRFAK